MNVRDALDGSKRRKTSGEIRNAIDVNPVPQPCIRVGTDRYDFSSRVSDPTVEGETKSKYRSEWIGFGACSIACFCRILRKGKFSVIIPRGENLK